MSAPQTEPIGYGLVAVSSRIRLARNFADYPFPNRLKDEEAAWGMIRLIASELNRVDVFKLYYMNDLSDGDAEFLKERYLISQDLIDNRPISAALVSKDESISVMLNEEDHVREQYFTRGFDLRRAYERIAGIDDIISAAIPFAYDRELGYLTACPTNLGTGMRASVMLFLPALARRGRMREIVSLLNGYGLTVRGVYGEGSGAEGDLFQISNEVTLGLTEAELLSHVEQAVTAVVSAELVERRRMRAEEGRTLYDRLLRAYGILTNCLSMGGGEFMSLMADVKLGVALGIFEGDLEELDELAVAMRPANINRLNGAPLDGAGRDAYRAEYVGKALRGMGLVTETVRNKLTGN